jgi:hypothetical protein
MRAAITAAMAALLVAASLFALARAEAAFGPSGPQQRISFMGPNDSVGYFGQAPSVAYNSSANEYLVVWFGDDNTAPLVDNEFEIFGQRLSSSGTPLGERIRISAQGADGDPDSEAHLPSVAYNAVANEYLVVWQGEVGTTSEFEIWGRRVSAAGQRLGGSDDLRISHMGPDGDSDYTAFDSNVTADPATGEYLVVWTGDDNTTPLVDNEYEIFGQRLNSAGQETGPDDFRISEQGADGNAFSQAFFPNATYNSKTGQFLVVWHGDIGTGASDEFEIWAQRLDAAGNEVGGSDFQVSDMGPDGNADYDAFTAKVAVDPTTGEYFVVWQGDDNTAPLVNDEYEIFGQRLTSAGAQVGADFRISEQGADGNPESEVARQPSIAFDSSSGEYLVAWAGEIGTSNSFEIWAQRLSATGAELGGSDFQISDMGPAGNASYNAERPSVAANPGPGEFLVLWSGDDDVNDELEIYGRWLGVLAPTLSSTDPAGPANENNPRVKGSVDPSARVDIFTNSRCLGAPAVNNAPGSALNGSGIAVPVADNTLTELSSTASEGTRTSRCSNSIFYTEATPPSPPPPPVPPPPRTDAAPVVSGFAVSPRRIRVGGRTTFRFRLSERATTRIVVERVLPGRKKRVKRAATLTFRNRPAGQNRIAYRARRLPSGSYRATIVATDAAGQRSTPRRAAFRLVRRR